MAANATAAPKHAAAAPRSVTVNHAPAKAAAPAAKQEAAPAPARAAAPALPAFAKPAVTAFHPAASPQAAAKVVAMPAHPPAATQTHPASHAHPAAQAAAPGHALAHSPASAATPAAGKPPATLPAHLKPGEDPKAAHKHHEHPHLALLPATHKKVDPAHPTAPHAHTAPAPAAPKLAPPKPAATLPAAALPPAPKPAAPKPTPPANKAPHDAAKPKLAPLGPPKTPSSGSGQPLAPHVKEAIQNSLMVDLSSVRLHASTAAERKAQSLSARAFTFGNDIYLGHGEHPTDLTLISHEAAHVIQQQHTAATVQAWSADRSDRYEREADQAAAAVVSGRSFTVRERVESPRVQRFGISDALDWLADKAYIIPGFRMFTIVLGVNPINMEHVERSPANVLRAIVEFLPGGTLITDVLDKYGVFDKVGGWISGKIDELGMVGSSIKQALMDFLDSLSWRDIFHLGDVWDRAKRIFTDPIDRIINFVKGTMEDIWKFIRDAILKPIAKLAEGTSGWPLLCAVLGKNPITGEAVPRTPETLIGGFMHLIHEDEIWENIKKANAISRAFAWFQSVLTGLIGFVSQIPDLFIKALKSLTLSDIIDLPGGFMKIVGVFGKFLVNFISWAAGKVWDLLQIIFEVVAPLVMPYLKRVGAAFKKILKDPIGFVRHLIDAGILGLNNFLKNFGDHLKKALLDWLTGSLPGIYIPKAFTLAEFGMFVLSVLGITWAQIRAKIVKALGPNGETIMKGLETAFDIVVALVKGGPSAAWELIKEKLTNLKDMVVDGIVGLVTDTIIKKAIPKLIAMFIPGAGFISAIISIYESIKVFVQKLAKIVAAVKAFVDSIVAIANGQIEGAASKVESGLEILLSLTISFLAGFFGLGGVASKVMEFIKKLQGMVDKGLDIAINFIITKAKALFGSLFGGKGDANQKLQDAMTAAQGVVSKYSGKKVGALILKPLLFAIKVRYGLQSLEAIPDGGKWAVRGTINPTSQVTTEALTDQEEGELSEQELMDMLVGQAAIIADGPQAGMTDTPPGQEKSVPATPKTSISVSSLGLSEEILYYYIDTSPAGKPRRDSVSQGVAAKIAQAQASQDSHDIYKALQQAGGMVNSLYPKGEPVVVVHHEQQVHDYPGTFPKTQLERVRIPKPVLKQMMEDSKQMKSSVKRIQAKYQAMKGLSKQEKKQKAQADIDELSSLIKQSLLDWKLTREKDEKGKRTPVGAQSTAEEPILDEIDLIAGSRRGHITVHRRSGGS